MLGDSQNVPVCLLCLLYLGPKIEDKETRSLEILVNSLDRRRDVHAGCSCGRDNDLHVRAVRKIVHVHTCQSDDDVRGELSTALPALEQAIKLQIDEHGRRWPSARHVTKPSQIEGERF